MDPLTMTLALASTAMTAFGKLGAGFANSDLDKLQQSIADSNTKLLVERAGLEKEGGQLAYSNGLMEETRTRDQVSRVLGGQTGHFAASNLDPTTGSPLLLQGFTAAQGQLDIGLIRARAEMGNANAMGRAASTMAQAAGSQGQATAFGMKAGQDIISGVMGAGTALLQGLSGMAGGGKGGGFNFGGTGGPQ